MSETDEKNVQDDCGSMLLQHTALVDKLSDTQKDLHEHQLALQAVLDDHAAQSRQIRALSDQSKQLQLQLEDALEENIRLHEQNCCSIEPVVDEAVVATTWNKGKHPEEVKGGGACVMQDNEVPTNTLTRHWLDVAEEVSHMDPLELKEGLSAMRRHSEPSTSFEVVAPASLTRVAKVPPLRLDRLQSADRRKYVRTDFSPERDHSSLVDVQNPVAVAEDEDPKPHTLEGGESGPPPGVSSLGSFGAASRDLGTEFIPTTPHKSDDRVYKRRAIAGAEWLLRERLEFRLVCMVVRRHRLTCQSCLMEWHAISHASKRARFAVFCMMARRRMKRMKRCFHALLRRVKRRKRLHWGAWAIKIAAKTSASDLSRAPFQCLDGITPVLIAHDAKAAAKHP